MTLHELNNLRYIDGEIRMLAEKIEELYTLAERATPSVTTYTRTNPDTGKKETCILPLSGGAGGRHSRTENAVEAIDKEKQLLRETLTKRQQEKQKLLKFIDTIPDCQIRQIFTYRFVNTMTWGQVAWKLGGGNTADGVRKRVTRYMNAVNMPKNTHGI